MDWIKIPTDEILFTDLKDWQSYALIKYQALYCQLEKEPTDTQLSRLLNAKERKFCSNYVQIITERALNQIFSVKKKRGRDKDRYEKKPLENNVLVENPLAERQLSDSESVDAPLSQIKSCYDMLSSDDKNYPFKGNVIKLNKKDYDLWISLYPNLDLKSELYARDNYLSKLDKKAQSNWFSSTSYWFAKINKEREKPSSEPKTVKVKLPPEGLDWRNM